MSLVPTAHSEVTKAQFQLPFFLTRSHDQRVSHALQPLVLKTLVPLQLQIQYAHTFQMGAVSYLHFPSLIFIGSQVSSSLGLKCLLLKMRFFYFQMTFASVLTINVIWNFKKINFFNAYCYLLFALSQLRVQSSSQQRKMIQQL